MKINFKKDKIEFEKKTNALDRLVIDFTSILNKLKIRYVIVSGYISILFGRSRSSEDVDLIVEKLDISEFEHLWKELGKKFVCIIIDDQKKAYAEYLLANHAIRFAFKNQFIPNIEVKFPKLELDEWVLDNRKEVIFNRNSLFISPIELQISYKLSLGSEKDIEDAKYLYELFKDAISMPLLLEFNRKLNIENLFKRYLK